MSKADDIFWRQFGTILIILTTFVIVVYFAARSIGADALSKALNHPSEVEQRILPVARVRIGDPTQVMAAPKSAAMTLAAAPPPADAAGADEGASVYAGACIACHQAGVAGAPKFGDAAAWSERVSLGEDALIASVINGKGAMPPKAGNPSLTEAQIRAAVEHMLSAVSEAGTPAGASADTGTAAATDTSTGTAADSGTAAGTDAGTAASTGAADTSGAATAVAASAGKPGDEVYNAVCVACHISGVAGAPKLTDKENWTTRASAGMSALVASVLNGKGAMPPKAGNPALEEADVENAVRYMLEQAGVSAGG